MSHPNLYELKDADPIRTLLWAGALGAFLLLSAGALLGVHLYFTHHIEAQVHFTNYYIGVQERDPRFFSRFEQGDYAVEARRAQTALLNSWSWSNKAKGTARIPISRAMEILLQKGTLNPRVVFGGAPGRAGRSP